MIAVPVVEIVDTPAVDVASMLLLATDGLGALLFKTGGGGAGRLKGFCRRGGGFGAARCIVS